MGLMLHCGGKEVTYADLQQVDMPPATRSYRPISYPDMVDFVRERIETKMPGAMREEQFALGRKGRQMFAVFTLDMDREDRGLSIGLRQSLDKSISAGAVAGQQVFVCDNLCFDGDSVRVVRKNTTNVWADFRELFDQSLERSTGVYYRMSDEFDRLQELECETKRGAELIGLAMYKDVLKPQQASETLRQWVKPDHADFDPRNLWSLYNAFTEALKKGTPNDVFERYTAAHTFFKGLTPEDVC